MSFIQLLSCVIIFTRRFKGHLEISASASRYQHWNWHRYQHYKNFICFVQLFFQKVEHLCPSCMIQYTSIFPILFFVLSYSTSITWLQLLISLGFLIHLFRGVHWCSSKKFVWIFGSTCSLAFLKKAALKTFGNFPVKHPCWMPF